MKPSLAEILKKGEYFGRLLAAGSTSSKEKVFLIYGLTGRSPTSQARRLVRRAEGIYTEPLPETSLTIEQRELLIYPVILFNRGIVASNGQQTREILKKLSLGLDDPELILKRALTGWAYEPDAPIFTPRISACVLPGGRLAMALIKRGENGQSLHEYYSLHLNPGEGYLLATYNGQNQNPPPSFSGPPLNFSMNKVRAREILEEFYEALAPSEGKEDWRVAAAVVTLGLPHLDLGEIEIINRF